jgi:hypothetical protein
MNGWPALTRHGPDASTPQKPEKRQSLSVVAQALAMEKQGTYLNEVAAKETKPAVTTMVQ